MLYGREVERSRIDELLEGARGGRSGVLVLRGEPGVGKSALFEYAHERATGMRVLSCRGVESEAQLPYAALHQLVRPVLGLDEDLPPPQAAALRGALGLASGGGDDRFLVSLGALSLLAEAAERQPVLCLVDDAHWLDDASADAFVFVARRLDAEGILMLFAAREGETRRFDGTSLPDLRLGGLDHEAAQTLLESHAPAPPSPAVREQLIDETGGNPLALIELSGTLSEAQLAGIEPLLAPLPVSARVEAVFLARVRRLPKQTQELLLVAAADDSAELSTVLAAAAHLGVLAHALDPAELDGLVFARGPQLEFRHPLVRSAVYHGATVAKRQAAHGALARVLAGEAAADRRAWHRAAATAEPDPAVVRELEDAAERARRRSALAAAALALERAAALTVDEHERARRLTAAAENAWLGGQPERALTLVERAGLFATEPIQRAAIARLLGLIEMTRGVPADACRLLLRAATDVASLDGERALDLLNLASLAAAYAGDREAAVQIAAVVRGLSVDGTTFIHVLAQLLVGLGSHAEGDFVKAKPKLGAALTLAESNQDPVALLFAGRAALYLGDDEVAYRTHHQAAAHARTRGALSILSQIQVDLAHAELWAGHWPAAQANASEGLQLAREIGQHEIAAQHLATLALIAAHHGKEDQCRSLAAETSVLASTRGLGIVGELTHWALARLELAQGRPEEAFRHCRAISSTIVVFWGVVDRIEAGLRAGKRESALAWLDMSERWAETTEAAWARAVSLHCRALVAEGELEAERLFLAALDAHSHATRPFERARTELALGEFLRRARRRVEARVHLREALATFETLGAELWAERARVELRASGMTARRREPSMRDELTPQELQIARFVGEGLTNREVAAQLFLSARTVDFHLRNIFRKLGITSRTQLARFHLDSETEHTPAASSPATRPVRA